MIYKRKYGLTVPEWRTLATLAEFGEMTAKQIGAHSAMHKTKVSRAVTSLDERRWLKRKRDDIDRRSETLQLTAQGMQGFRKLEPEMLGYETGLLDRLTVSERNAMLEGLAVLEKALGIIGRT